MWLIISLCYIGTAIGQWQCTGLQVNRLSEQSCTWGMIHTTNSSYQPRSPAQYSLTVQNCDLKYHSLIHSLYGYSSAVFLLSINRINQFLGTILSLPLTQLPKEAVFSIDYVGCRPCIASSSMALEGHHTRSLKWSMAPKGFCIRLFVLLRYLIQCVSGKGFIQWLQGEFTQGG